MSCRVSIFRMICLSTLGLCLTSCFAEKRPCTTVGRRIGERPISGIIYGLVARIAYVDVCPGVKLRFSFIGPEPADFTRLKQSAQERGYPVRFRALGDGYIVVDDPNRFSLLLVTLSNIQEDPRGRQSGEME